MQIRRYPVCARPWITSRGCGNPVKASEDGFEYDAVDGTQSLAGRKRGFREAIDDYSSLLGV